MEHTLIQIDKLHIFYYVLSQKSDIENANRLNDLTKTKKINSHLFYFEFMY